MQSNVNEPYFSITKMPRIWIWNNFCQFKTNTITKKSKMFCSLSQLLIWHQPKPSGPFINYNNENRKVQQWNATKCRYCIADCPAGLWLYRTGWWASTNQRAGMWVVRTVRRGGAGSNRTTTHRCTSAPRPLERKLTHSSSPPSSFTLMRQTLQIGKRP